MVALGGVVVDDVEDGLDPGGVQLADRRLEAAEAGIAEVARIGCEVGERSSSPRNCEAPLDQEAVVREGLDRQELEGGDAELPQVLDDGRVRRGPRRCRARLRHVRVGLGQRLDMRLVDHRLGEGPAARAGARGWALGAVTTPFGTCGALSRRSIVVGRCRPRR